MIVVDTTVLVYAVGSDHALRHPCRELIGWVASGEISATTTVEVIQEFCHVRARRRSREDATALGLAYAKVFAPLLTADGVDLVEGLGLFARSDQLGAFDSVLVETARRHGASSLVSADRSFAGIQGVQHLDPAGSDFADRIRRIE